MNPEEIKNFLTSLKGTDIEELRLEAGESKLSFRRNNVTVVVPPVAAPVVAKAAAVKEPENQLAPLKSSMVGTFFYSDSPNKPPFVMEGVHVVPGQKIGIIETMKIMKDITSSIKGKIVKVMVKNGQPVEYGQELFMVDTEDVK